MPVALKGYASRYVVNNGKPNFYTQVQKDITSTDQLPDTVSCPLFVGVAAAFYRVGVLPFVPFVSLVCHLVYRSAPPIIFDRALY